MAGKPIPVAAATEMTRLYADYVKTLPVPPVKKTEYVAFTVTEIMEWLKEVTPFADEIRIFMGEYPQGSGSAGRVTTIVWPYKDGSPATRPLSQGKDGGGGDEEIDPYDDGTTGP